MLPAKGFFPMKFTNKTIAALVLPEGKDDHFEWDDDLPRFFHRLRRSGDKVNRSWGVQYRNADGQSRKMSFPATVLNLDQAREKAKNILAEVQLGKDPQSEKKQRASAGKFTFKSLAERYLADKKSELRPRSLVETTRYLQSPAYFGPLFNMAASAVARNDIADRLLIIKRDCGVTTAIRARSNVSAMYAWAIGEGLVENNPVIGTKRPKPPPSGDHVLTDEELIVVWNAAGDDDFGRILKLLILTGARRNEIGGLRHSEINYNTNIWTLPAARAKNNRELVLPLPSLAVEIIRSVPQVVGRDALFGARGPGFSSWADHKKQLDDRLGDQVRPFRLHDLRRTFCTRLAELGAMPHIIETAINHASGHKGGVAGVYNHSRYGTQLRTMMAMWDSHISALISGRDERKVIPIRG
jgi:integrase